MRRAAILLALVLCPSDALAQVLDLMPEAVDHIPVERGAMVDWYPGASGFRISGGVRESLEVNRRGEQRGEHSERHGHRAHVASSTNGRHASPSTLDIPLH